MKNLFAVILLFNTTFVFALNSGDFTIQLISAPYFVVDGNSPAAGPQSAYVGFEIKNINGSITYSNLKFTITSIGTSVVGQNYTLVSPASGITLVGTLAPGETKTCYYYVTYPANISPTATFSYALTDATASSKTGIFQLLKYTATAASYSTGSLTTTTAGFIGITQFGTAQNTVSVSAPLPLTFESFNGNFVNDKVILRWTTSSESNSSSFDVERSPDGMNFLKIGSVKASNYSTAIESYSFVDSASSIGTNYYRLKAIDINGNFKYSSITAIRPTLNLPPLEVVNPFYDKLQIKLILTNMQKVHIRLFDKRGLLVKSEIHHCNSGANAIELNSANTLSKGVYVLQVDIAGKTISRQVIKD